MTWMRTVALAVVMVLTANLAMAKDEAKEAGKEKTKKEPPPMVAVTLTGTISVENGSRTVKNKKTGEEKEVKYTRYWLTGDDGKKMPIAQPRAKKGEKPVVNLADYVDKKVTIKGQGYTHTHKDKKSGAEVTKTQLKVIESVEEVTE